MMLEKVLGELMNLSEFYFVARRPFLQVFLFIMIKGLEKGFPLQNNPLQLPLVHFPLFYFLFSLCHRFNRILCTRSYSHLRAVYDQYEKIKGTTMEKAIKKEMSGDLEKAYLAIGEVLMGTAFP